MSKQNLITLEVFFFSFPDKFSLVMKPCDLANSQASFNKYDIVIIVSRI